MNLSLEHPFQNRQGLRLTTRYRKLANLERILMCQDGGMEMGDDVFQVNVLVGTNCDNVLPRDEWQLVNAANTLTELAQLSSSLQDRNPSFRMKYGPFHHLLNCRTALRINLPGFRWDDIPRRGAQEPVAVWEEPAAVPPPPTAYRVLYNANDVELPENIRILAEDNRNTGTSGNQPGLMFRYGRTPEGQTFWDDVARVTSTTGPWPTVPGEAAPPTFVEDRVFYNNYRLDLPPEHTRLAIQRYESENGPLAPGSRINIMRFNWSRTPESGFWSDCYRADPSEGQPWPAVPGTTATVGPTTAPGRLVFTENSFGVTIPTWIQAHFDYNRDRDSHYRGDYTIPVNSFSWNGSVEGQTFWSEVNETRHEEGPWPELPPGVTRRTPPEPIELPPEPITVPVKQRAMASDLFKL